MEIQRELYIRNTQENLTYVKIDDKSIQKMLVRTQVVIDKNTGKKKTIKHFRTIC